MSALTDIIAAHTPADIGMMPRPPHMLETTCQCGWEGLRDYYADHLAETIAAAPNLAIIELPERDIRLDTWCAWGENENISTNIGEGWVRCYLEHPSLTITQARETAAALLAAAKAAEQ